MSINIRVSPGILPSIASSYQDPSRVFMEYIDNSLDSASKLLDDNENKYSRKIKIQVLIDSKNKTVTFIDNCLGMDEDNLIKIVADVGNSSKKNDFLTNGQFGFGIHSYLACAEEMEVQTLSEDSDSQLSINVKRSQYTNEGTIDDLVKLFKNDFPSQSGTIVKLSKFDKKWWKDVSPVILQAEVERHFEQLLTNDNLEIKIISNNEEILCQAFDYDAYAGILINRQLDEVKIKDYQYKLPRPIKVYLKVTDDIIISKRPIFMSKGRRIEEVLALKSFRNKSIHKTGLWGHQNLTGYIEVWDLISPEISRDDFVRSSSRQAIYAMILELEEEIYDKLREINKSAEDASFNKLEDALNSIVEKLAREDNLKLKEMLQLSGDDVHLEDGDSSALEKGNQSDEGIGSGVKSTNSTGGGNATVAATTIDETGHKGRYKKSSGMEIKFLTIEPKNSDGTYARSSCPSGDTIFIYKNHKDFKDRLKRTNQGEPKLTDRLLSYLASEISIYYKDQFFAKHGKQPEIQRITNSRKELFANIFDFQYTFEEALQSFSGKNLNTLEDIMGD
ncbi:MAG: hypothetical protein HAW67_00275 [Endozoicomonadaceae bacterium]|nr:hypothetical protein [Endozoicomonadaceae bacterium]